jgi:dCMP deaminase
MLSEDKARKFLNMATEMAETFSKDQHKQVGCILLDPQTFLIRAMTYNGTPLGIEDTPARWERDNKPHYIVHAELGAICACARHGTPTIDSIAVVSYHPCSQCARALIQAGISQVVTHPPDYLHPRWGTEFIIATELFQEAGIQVTLL